MPEYTRIRQLQTAEGLVEQCAILDYVLAPRDWALPVSAPRDPPCVLTVAPEWRLPGADHVLIWFSIPHSLQSEQPNLHTRCMPNIHLLTTPSDLRQEHRDNYETAVADAMQGYEDLVADLLQCVLSGGMTAAAATNHAKEELCRRIHSAVTASIGHKQPHNRTTFARHPPIFNREVRAATKARRETEQHLATARANAMHTDNPDCQAQLQAAQAAHQEADSAVKAIVAAGRKAKLAICIDAISSSADQNDMKGVWRGLRQLASRAAGSNSGPTMLRNEVGRLVVDSQSIANVLAAQYQQVTDENVFATGTDFEAEHKASIEAAVSAHRMSTEHGPEQLCEAITLMEVQLHCAKLHNCKAPSPIDGINNELLKYSSEPMHQALQTLFNLEFTLEHKAQTPGVIIPLYKKDDPTLAVNYSPTTLGSTLDKLYNIIIIISYSCYRILGRAPGTRCSKPLPPHKVVSLGNASKTPATT